MEGHCQLFSLPDCSDPAAVFGEDFHAGDTKFDLRRSDETHGHIFYSGKSSAGVKAADLSAVGIAAYRDTQCTEVYSRIIQKLLRKQDRSGTGGHYRKSLLDTDTELIEHIQFPEQFPLNGTFSSRQDQSIKILGQIAFLAQLAGGNFQTFEDGFVFRKIPLQCKNCDPHQNPVLP